MKPFRPSETSETLDLEIQSARSEIQATGWTSTETGIWGTVFAFAHEFGWTAHYTLNEVPVYWVKKLFEQLKEYSEMQKDAMKGKHHARAVQLPEQEKERRDRLLAKLDGKNYEEIHSDKIFG